MCPACIEYQEIPHWDEPPEGLIKDFNSPSETTFLMLEGASIEGTLMGQKVKVTETKEGFRLHYINGPADVEDILYEYKHHEGVSFDKGDTVTAIPPAPIELQE